jgi:hypothetical protein
MLDCRKLDFSPKLAAARIEAAEAVFGERVLKRMVAFTLFILGVNRARIAEVLSMPPGTVRSLIRRLLGTGVDGFVDHRCKAVPEAAVRQTEPPPAMRVHAEPEAEPLVVVGGELQLPKGNPIQRKVVLLSLIGEGLLSAEDVAPVLGLSASHVRRLHRDLMASDVEAVIDKRRGQLRDYRVDSDLKGQMIVQFVLELAECGRASSGAVARRLGLNCNEHVPERTVRHHLSRMGLTLVRESLVAGLRDIKRGSGD